MIKKYKCSKVNELNLKKENDNNDCIKRTSLVRRGKIMKLNSISKNFPS